MWYILLPLIMSAITFALSRNKVITILSFIANLVIVFFTLPTVAVGFSGIIYMLLFTCIGTCLLLSINDEKNKAITSFISCSIIALIFGIFNFSSGTMINAKDHYSLIGSVEEGDFSTDVEIIDISQIRTVDSLLAKRRAEELLGKEESLGSRVDIGKMSIQNVNGQLLWVGALEPSGFFKWLNMDGTPGFVTVSATNYSDAKLITGKKFHYTQQSFFGKSLDRYLYNNGYSNTGYTDYTLELDDNNNPFWVISLYDKEIFYNGDKVYGIITINPETGEIVEYDIDNAPKWVDRIQPEGIVLQQLKSWASLGVGWLEQSPFGGKVGVKQPTSGLSLVYTANGKSMWYTGITSVSKDSGTTGFTLTNTRTGLTRYYKKPGPTEVAAKKVIEGTVSNFAGYHATLPIMYNINGSPTYVSTIKDGSGNIKQFGLASATDRSIFGTGDTLQKAVRAYQTKAKKSANIVPGNIDYKIVTGIIERIGFEITDGNGRYYFILNSKDVITVAYTISSTNVEAQLTRPGDFVTLSVLDSDLAVQDIVEFDNKRFDLSDSE